MKNRALPLVLLLLSACSASDDDADAPSNPVALVTLARAEPGRIANMVTLYGTTEGGASGRHVLSAGVEAVVTRIDAPVGSAVSAGQAVALLTPSPTSRLDLAKASSDARAADQAYARARRMRQDGLVSDADVETARAAAASADATRNSLSGRAGTLMLRAPMNGYVETVPVNPGDTVQPGAAVATISRSGDLRARFGADPSIARSLHAGDTIMVHPSAGGAGLRLRIRSVSPLVDPQTRLVPIFAPLPAGSALAVGETLTAQAMTGNAPAALTIPYAALLDDGGQPYVYVVRSGVAHRRDVLTGATGGDRIAILKGLNAGDMVATDGGTAIEDGMKVRTR